MRLDWQKKAVVIFAVAISSLSILLTIFAIRAADRERLVLERGMQEEQRGLAELIVSQIKATVSELEGRTGRLISSYQFQSQADLVGICRRIVEGEEIVAEIFTIDEDKEIKFPLTKPFYASV